MRVRSHQNPFAVYKDFDPLNVNEIFAKPENPLALEIGFAGGQFLLQFCRKYPDYNLIGLEIRKLLVNKVAQEIHANKLTNAHVIHANANTALTQLLEPETLEKIFIFFPDPWIKKKHLKRRLVNKNFVKNTLRVLKPEGEVFIQTDVKFLGDEIRDFYESDKGFDNLYGPYKMEQNNYTGCYTERESFCYEDNNPVYRYRYIKKER